MRGGHQHTTTRAVPVSWAYWSRSACSSALRRLCSRVYDLRFVRRRTAGQMCPTSIQVKAGPNTRRQRGNGTIVHTFMAISFWKVPTSVSGMSAKKFWTKFCVRVCNCKEFQPWAFTAARSPDAPPHVPTMQTKGVHSLTFMGSMGLMTTLSVISALLMPLFTYLVNLQHRYAHASLGEAQCQCDPRPGGTRPSLAKNEQARHVTAASYPLGALMLFSSSSECMTSSSSLMACASSSNCSAATVDTLRHLYSAVRYRGMNELEKGGFASLVWG